MHLTFLNIQCLWFLPLQFSSLTDLPLLVIGSSVQQYVFHVFECTTFVMSVWCCCPLSNWRYRLNCIPLELWTWIFILELQLSKDYNFLLPPLFGSIQMGDLNLQNISLVDLYVLTTPQRIPWASGNVLILYSTFWNLLLFSLRIHRLLGPERLCSSIV